MTDEPEPTEEREVTVFIECAELGWTKHRFCTGQFRKGKEIVRCDCPCHKETNANSKPRKVQ